MYYTACTIAIAQVLLVRPNSEGVYRGIGNDLFRLGGRYKRGILERSTELFKDSRAGSYGSKLGPRTEYSGY